MTTALPSVLLVVDQDVDAARIAELLSGATIRRERSLAEAIAEPPAEVTLLDLGPTTREGLERLRRYRAAHGDVPVVVLTGVDNDELGREAIRLGAQDYLSTNKLSSDLLRRTIAHAKARHALGVQLQHSEERLRSLVAAVPDLLLEVDAQGQVLMANRGFGPLTAEDFVGSRWETFVPQAERARYEEARGRVFALGATVSFETKVAVGVGGAEWFEVSLAPIGSVPNVERCAVLCRNVTALRQQQERYEEALEAAPGGMLLVDDEGRIVLANRSVEAIFGYDRGELIGATVDRLVPQALREGHRLQRTGYLSAVAPRAVMGRELTGTSKSGEIIPIEIGLTPVHTSRGTEVLCSVTDVRQRKELEDQLRQAQKMEAVGRLAGGVAHDFNNLLTAILSFGEFVGEELPAVGTVRDDMNEVMAAAKRASALTSQLLAFSRRQPVSPRAESLCTLVADLEKMLRRIIGEDVHLQTNTDVECDLVMIDRGVFEHVLLNLAVNARDAMPKGGTLYIGCSNETLEAAAVDAGDRALPPGRYVRLRVRDDGVGMTEETQAHMFEPFFTTKQLGRGTGLGLSTVYGIVSQASGFIRVSSGVGAGTTIDIYLPPSADGTSRTVRPPGTASLRGSERILVVEDDDQVRAITQRALEHFGYQVVTASRAAEALAIVADDSSFDLILTDLVMPDMSGAELAEHLSETLGVRVLFMTGYAPESVAERGIVAAGEVLRKPFSRIELGERVRALLDDQA